MPDVVPDADTDADCDADVDWLDDIDPLGLGVGDADCDGVRDAEGVLVFVAEEVGVDLALLVCVRVSVRPWERVADEETVCVKLLVRVRVCDIDSC